MSPIERKKIIPKFKKKLQGFLSDESGKITKEDVLKMGMIAMWIAALIPSADAAVHCNTIASVASHANWWSTLWTATAINSTESVFRWCKNVDDSAVGTVYVSAAIAPYSQTVNWHANSSATIQWWEFNGMNLAISLWQSHGSHGSHGSHASY